jgi:hypothetical protein
MYVLDCLHNGLSEDNIIRNCDGDGQTVKIWLDLLKENKWVVKDDANNWWVLTRAGNK